MKHLLATVAIIGTCLTSQAQANVQDDINTCKDEVAVIMQQERESRTVSTGVRVATGFIGALIGHGNAEAAVGSAVRSGGYALSSGVNSDASRQKMYMNQCMRKQQAAARKAGR